MKFAILHIQAFAFSSILVIIWGEYFKFSCESPKIGLRRSFDVKALISLLCFVFVRIYRYSRVNNLYDRIKVWYVQFVLMIEKWLELEWVYKMGTFTTASQYNEKCNK